MSPVPVSAFVAPFSIVHSQQRRRTLRRGGAAAAGSSASPLSVCWQRASQPDTPTTRRRRAGPRPQPRRWQSVPQCTAGPLTAWAGTRPYQVEAIRLSTGTPGYAFASIDPTSQQLDGAAVALHATPTTGGHLSWRVFDVGSRHVGCSAPLAVRSEFALHC